MHWVVGAFALQPYFMLNWNAPPVVSAGVRDDHFERDVNPPSM
jgi:hypothetical protein